MNKAEKIKAEIERLKKSLPWGSCASQISMECNCKNEAYNEMLKFIDSLEEEPVSNDLEEAACEYDNSHIDDNNLAFKAGAQWHKKQMIDKAFKYINYQLNLPNDFEQHFRKAMEE